MKTFFESVVKDVLSQVTLDKTFFIIPNRRSKTFLKKEIIFMDKNKKILVVGAGGFIGGHLVKKLIENGNE